MHLSRAATARHSLDGAYAEMQSAVADGRMTQAAASVAYGKLADAYHMRRSGLSITGLAETFARNWAERAAVGPADGFKVAAE